MPLGLLRFFASDFGLGGEIIGHGRTHLMALLQPLEGEEQIIARSSSWYFRLPPSGPGNY